MCRLTDDLTSPLSSPLSSPPSTYLSTEQSMPCRIHLALLGIKVVFQVLFTFHIFSVFIPSLCKPMTFVNDACGPIAQL